MKKNNLVYYNSRKKCFSIKRKGEKIVHSNDFWMAECSCKIWKSGREKAIKTGIKNVHAFISGIMVKKVRLNLKKVELKYSPFNGINGFYYEKNKVCEKPLKYCHFHNGRVFAYISHEFF